MGIQRQWRQSTIWKGNCKWWMERRSSERFSFRGFQDALIKSISSWIWMIWIDGHLIGWSKCNGTICLENHRQLLIWLLCIEFIEFEQFERHASRYLPSHAFHLSTQQRLLAQESPFMPFKLNIKATTNEKRCKRINQLIQVWTPYFKCNLFYFILVFLPLNVIQLSYMK